MPASSILLLETDPAAAEAHRDRPDRCRLRGHDRSTIRTRPSRGVADHQLVIIDVVPGPETAPADVCREIRATPALAVDAGDVHQPDRRRRGADPVPRGRRGRRHRQAVRRPRARGPRRGAPAPVPALDGIVATVDLDGRAHRHPTAPDGRRSTARRAASGRRRSRSTSAIARRTSGSRTGSCSSTSTSSSARSRRISTCRAQTLADLVRDDVALREPELLRTLRARHDSGLACPRRAGSPEQAELVTAEHVERILDDRSLEPTTPWSIDAGSTLDERTLAAFERAEVVVLPVYPEIAALKAVHALLDYLNEAGSVSAKSMFVLNNMFAKELLKMRDVEAAPRHEGLARRCRTTRSSTSRRSTRASRSSSARLAPRCRRPSSRSQRSSSASGPPSRGRRPRNASRAASATSSSGPDREDALAAARATGSARRIDRMSPVNRSAGPRPRPEARTAWRTAVASAASGS